MPAALIMAGGRSSRMRATHGPVHKALVEVLGVPMIERNLSTLLRQGFDDVTIAIADPETEVRSWVRSRGEQIAGAAGARLRTLVEETPLGTIGAARLVDTAQSLVVVNVDNLSALDLLAFERFHRASAAALTVAVHEERLAVPFGVVRTENDALIEYIEKPEQHLLVSSGTYVLSQTAREAVNPEGATGIPELIDTLIGSGRLVAAFKHDAPWIDVNDVVSLHAAEALIERSRTLFDSERATR